MKTIKAKYISDIPSIFFKKGEVYEGFYPLDNQSGEFIAFRLEGMDEDEPGDFALPASRFEIIND